jgi:hypothetical protein
MIKDKLILIIVVVLIALLVTYVGIEPRPKKIVFNEKTQLYEVDTNLSLTK